MYQIRLTCSWAFANLRRAGVPRNDDSYSAATQAQDMYGNLIDFIVDAGPRQQVFSTVVDWSVEEPCILREGAGSLEHLSGYMDI